MQWIKVTRTVVSTLFIAAAIAALAACAAPAGQVTTVRAGAVTEAQLMW
ncbi:hypothetical protein AB0J57_29580 [Streptomyces sp. NPDC049837]